MSPEGRITDCLYLDTFSKRLPMYVSSTCNDTFLVVFNNRGHDSDIIEIDLQGRLLWTLPSNVRHIGIPASVQLTRVDTILIADLIRHVAMEIDRSGELLWQFGKTKHPSRKADYLSSPMSARRIEDGRSLISDTRNRRIVIVDSQGDLIIEISSIRKDSGSMRKHRPRYVEVTPEGTMVIDDTGHNRILAIQPSGNHPVRQVRLL